ncbi:MAG: hypothetical protein OHK0029_21370 [Armatimonadaceae bacterium]
MAREENMLILKMLQEGTITAEQAAELLNALEVQGAKTEGDAAASGTQGTPSAPPTPPTPPTGTTETAGPAMGITPPPPPPPVTPVVPDLDDEGQAKPGTEEPHGDIFDKARARIATARERISGMQEQLSAAEEKVSQAKESEKPFESLADALKDLPGARAVSDALRDPGRLAANARRQARRVARQFRSSLGDLNIDFDNLRLGEAAYGEPTLSAPREVTTSVSAGKTLRVRNPLGDIEARDSDVPDVRVAGVLRVWATDEETAKGIAEQIKLNVEQSDEGPSVVVTHAGKTTRRVALDLKVFVPKNDIKVSLLSPAGDVNVQNHKGAVVLATQSGDAKASEIVGDVAAETASGDIITEGVVGNVQASSASGDISAIRVTGDSFKAISQSGDVSLREATIPAVVVETVSGDAQVEGVSGKSLRVRSVSGDVFVEKTLFEDETHLDTVSGVISLEPKGPINKSSLTLATVSGDVELKLVRETAASLEVSTKGGDVSGKYLDAEGNEKELTGSGMVSLSETVGKGAGAKIVLTSVSGDITVHQDTPTIEFS